MKKESITGKEVRYILRQNRVNLRQLADAIGISPQALNSRLNATVFSPLHLDEITDAIGRDLFGASDTKDRTSIIPVLDLLRYDFRDTDTLEYTRYKSRNTKRGDKRVSMTIPPEAREIIDRYMNKQTGRITVPDIKYVSLQNVINKALKDIGKSLGIRHHERLCWYTARKSFVQHGFELGITLEVLEYTIGQSVKTNRPIFNYIKIMRRHADDAIRRIIDNLQQNPPSAP